MTGRAPKPVRVFASGVCAYELAALWSDRLPTITAIVKAHPWIAPVILGALAYHFQPEARW